MKLSNEDQAVLKNIQSEYDHLFETDPIRDEDRAYQWFTNQVFKNKPEAVSLLDIACGAGYFLKNLKEKFGSACSLNGIDFSSKALELAKNECPGASLYQGPAEDLPFEKEAFDAVTCLGSLEQFFNAEGALNEMKRVSKPGARVFILVPNIFWYKDFLSVLFTGTRKTRNQSHETFLSLGEWKDVLVKGGVKVVKTEKYNGIAKAKWKQTIKDLVIPTRFSYHFLFVCTVD